MKLRRRRKKGEDCHCALSRYPARPRPELPLPLPPSSLHHSILSPSTQPHQPASRRPSLSAATCRKIVVPAISSPSCPASPFLLHKITEAEERGGKGRGGHLACRPSCPTQRQHGARPARQPPLLLHPIEWRPPAPVSRCALSTSSEAIGKQEPKMNYPVSSPSLTNK